MKYSDLNYLTRVHSHTPVIGGTDFDTLGNILEFACGFLIQNKVISKEEFRGLAVTYKIKSLHDLKFQHMGDFFEDILASCDPVKLQALNDATV